MRTIVTLLFLALTANLFADTSPDSLAVARLYSTSWELTERYVIRRGIFHKPQKIHEKTKERMTIYNNEIHFEVDSTYQVCAMRHRNRNELWLDCKRTDQLIYRVAEIKGNELVIDVLTKQRDGKYIRTGRRYYRRATN
jgi:hypothetical protein